MLIGFALLAPARVHARRVECEAGDTGERLRQSASRSSWLGVRRFPHVRRYALPALSG